MPKRKRPTCERLKELFNYDPETGIFTRRTISRRGPSERKRAIVGAGWVSELGYVMLTVDGTSYIAGQLAWLHQHGQWPEGRIKYINGDGTDNRIANIRIQSSAVTKDVQLTQARLKQLLHYEPETGHFTWRVSSSVHNPGERAGGGHGLGYRSIGIDYGKYLEHRLAWLYMTGEEAKAEVDHINGDKSDNRWSNLREATRSQNGHNKKMWARNKTGVTGISVHGDKYRAVISVGGQTIHLGRFNTIEEATEARASAKERILGQFGLRSKEKK